ncbi:SRPBCC family protein [Mycobacterium sp. CVI_P3]|uniref:SRPBCC family protein n=1 Tax=Mycobacterium pinniadriaticum TaxID=2994102 RepID=A0ABT3SCZ2_9MYCO|nr:SRPBCC family protein [Mycobacterium pinniadriaticum]MCX2930957.1 SRPBCC family protein [Mycobacterium pinniadriaticum]MCX2937381.1 SRPBCC family protein [Mycobacterium pinniadriaticum]
MATAQTTITAPAAEIIAVLADLPGMLDWSAADSVQVIEYDAQARPVLARWREHYGPLPDEFVLRYEWDGDTGVSWRLVQGRILKKEDGHYRLSPAPAGATTVEYQLALGIGVWLPPCIRSRLEATIVDATLAALKRRVETG